MQLHPQTRLWLQGLLLCLAFAGGAHAETPVLLPPVEEVAPPPPTVPVPAAEPLPESHGFWIDANPWWPCVGWEGSVEFGLNGSSGNSQTFNIHTGANFVRKTEGNKLTIEIAQNQATDNDVETKNNARLTVRDDILFHESPWTLFAKAGFEYDEFTAYDSRLTLNGGVGYCWIKTDIATFTTRFGAGVSHEFDGPDNDWTPEAVFGLDLERQLTKMQKFTAKAEYLPDWSDYENFRVVTDLAWVLALDMPSKLSVKLSVNDQYDSTSNGAKPNDLNYAALLLWKF